MKPEYVDSTRYKDSLQCLRLYYWRHERHLVSPQPALSLIFGGAIHAGLAERYRGKPLNEQLMAFDKEWLRAEGQEDNKRSAKRGMDTLVAYHREFVQDNFKVLNVEMPFVCPIHEGIVWTGIIDLMFELSGRIILMDHKTSSYLNEKWWTSTLNPNHQFTGYLMGAREVTGIMPDAMMVNAILVDKSRNAFERRITTRTPQELHHWKEEFVSWWSIVRECRRTNSWPRNDDRCGRWPQMCQYHFLCTLSGVDYRTYEPSQELYIREEWDPLEAIRKRKEE